MGFREGGVFAEETVLVFGDRPSPQPYPGVPGEGEGGLRGMLRECEIIGGWGGKFR